MATSAWERAGGRPLRSGEIVFESTARLALSGQVSQGGAGAIAITSGPVGARLHFTISGGILRRGLESSIALSNQVLEMVKVSPARRKAERTLLYIPTATGPLQVDLAEPDRLVEAMHRAVGQVPEGPWSAEARRIQAAARAQAVSADEKAADSKLPELKYQAISDLIGQVFLVELADETIVRAYQFWDPEDLADVMDGEQLDFERCRRLLDSALETDEEVEDVLEWLRVQPEVVPFDIKAPPDEPL